MLGRLCSKRNSERHLSSSNRSRPLARRLAENPDVSVLLLEAGGSDDVPSVMEASQWDTNLGSDRDWTRLVLKIPAAVPAPSWRLLRQSNNDGGN